MAVRGDSGLESCGLEDLLGDLELIFYRVPFSSGSRRVARICRNDSGRQSNARATSQAGTNSLYSGLKHRASWATGASIRQQACVPHATCHLTRVPAPAKNSKKADHLSDCRLCCSMIASTNPRASSRSPGVVRNKRFMPAPLIESSTRTSRSVGKVPRLGGNNDFYRSSHSCAEAGG